MNFEYNGNKTEKDRVTEVACDIISYYKELPPNIAIIVAKLENPITTKKDNLMLFKRLYNMLFVLNNQSEYKNTYDKVVNDLGLTYNQIINNSSTNNEEVNLINNIYIELDNYFNGSRNDFPIIGEFYE